MVLLRPSEQFNKEREAVMSNHQWALACHLAQTQLERDIRPLRAKFEHELQRRLAEEEQERRARQWELSQLCKEATWAEERSLSLLETNRRREQAYLADKKVRDDLAIESVRRAHEHKARHNEYHRQRREALERRQVYNERIHAHQAEVAARARDFEANRVAEDLKRQEQLARRREDAAEKRAYHEAQMEMQRQAQKDATVARLQAHKEKCQAHLDRKAAVFDQKIARVDGLLSARGEALSEMQRCRIESARQCEALRDMMHSEAVSGRGFSEIRSQFETLVPQLRSAPRLRSASMPQSSRFQAKATPARGRSHSFEKRLIEKRLKQQVGDATADTDTTVQPCTQQEAVLEMERELKAAPGSISTNASTTPPCPQSVSVTNSPPASHGLSVTSTPGMSFVTNPPSMSGPPTVTIRASSSPPSSRGVAYMPVATTAPAAELAFTSPVQRSQDHLTTFCSPPVVQGIRTIGTAPVLGPPGPDFMKTVSECGSTTDAGLSSQSFSPLSFRSDNPTSPARSSLLGLSLRPRAFNFGPDQR